MNIVKKKASVELVDLMEGCERWEIQIGEHGLVALVDMMPRLVPTGRTADCAVVRAARTSTGQGLKSEAEDRGLERYLFRHSHSTPFEMVDLCFHHVLPIFVARQLIRHRTACLAGDVNLHFDLPGGIERRGNQLYTLTIAAVYAKFQPTVGSQGDQNFKRNRVQNMLLRSVDEATGDVIHTRIVDVWESGIKPCYRVTLENGASAVMSADHRCLTDRGWLSLKDFAVLPMRGTRSLSADAKIMSIGPGSGTGVLCQQIEIDEGSENWLPVVGWEEYYAVSDQGRVRRIVGGKGSRSFGRCKKLTPSDGRLVVSLNRPGVQEVRLVHHLVLEAFVGPATAGLEGCHENGNGYDNRVDNLRWGTPQSNADDRVRDGATTRLLCNAKRVVEITYIGDVMTYDLEVEGPSHNFSAGGLVVHNSVNEYSLRYSEAQDRFWFPDADNVRQQSKTNKQGGDQSISLLDAQVHIEHLHEVTSKAWDNYQADLGKGVSRELSRTQLPVNLFTEWYWEIDLKNLLHFLGLRQDSHAQKEIRDYADAMYELIKPLVPVAIEAYDDYHPNRGGLLLSRLDIKVLNGGHPGEVFANERELQEHADKMERIGQNDAAETARWVLAHRLELKQQRAVASAPNK